MATNKFGGLMYVSSSNPQILVSSNSGSGATSLSQSCSQPQRPTGVSCSIVRDIRLYDLLHNNSYRDSSSVHVRNTTITSTDSYTKHLAIILSTYMYLLHVTTACTALHHIYMAFSRIILGRDELSPTATCTL